MKARVAMAGSPAPGDNSPMMTLSEKAAPLPRSDKPGGLKRLPLGQTGLFLPPIFYGTSSLGNLYQALPVGTKKALVESWVDTLGLPLVLDTAGKYGAGMALESLGNVLRDLSIPPDDLVLSNKLGWYQVPLSGPEPTFEPGAWVGVRHDATCRISYQGILDCFHQGNELLGPPYQTSLAAVHDPDEYLSAAPTETEKEKRLEDILGAYRALSELKAGGKVRAIGVGSKDWKVIRDIESRVKLDWVMLACSFTVHRHPPELRRFMECLRARGVGIINSAVFNGGFLTGGAYYDYQKVDPAKAAHRPLFEWRETFHKLCRAHAVDPSAACVQFALGAPGVVSIALNTSKPEKVASNHQQLSAPIPKHFWAEAKGLNLVDPSCDWV